MGIPADWKIKVYMRENQNADFKYIGVTYIPDSIDIVPRYWDNNHVFDDHLYKYVFFQRGAELGWWTSDEDELSHMGYDSYLEDKE